MNLKKLLKKYFAEGNVCVTGLRGSGKDMLFANVIAIAKQPYISNMDYKVKRCLHIPLNLVNLDVKNNYNNLISGDIVPYDYPYPENVNIYVSDCGVYFPAQDFTELNRKYPAVVNFQALSRHLGNCNFHINAQNLNRVWDKIREQSDIYIRCLSCKVLKLPLIRRDLVIQQIITYDNYDACVKRVKPFKNMRVPLMNKAGQRELILNENERYKRDFEERNGTVKKHLLIYFNRSNYDTRYFKKLLKGVVKCE